MTVTLKFKADGLERLQDVLLELQVLKLTVGFQGETGEQVYPGTTVTVAEVARYQEFGTEDIPARSFLRKAVFSGRKKIQAESKKQIRAAVMNEKTPVEALSEIGIFAADLIVTRIRSGNFKALAPATIAAKGHDRPLIESYLLVSSVSWAVHRYGLIVAQGVAA